MLNIFYKIDVQQGKFCLSEISKTMPDGIDYFLKFMASSFKPNLPCVPIANKMNRRIAFKNIVLVSGALIMLPPWMQSCGITDRDTHFTTFSQDEQNILASVVDTIIPSGNNIGGLSAGVDKYLQKMIEDCYEISVRENVKKQLQALNIAASKGFGKSFADCTQQQRQSLLLNISISQDKDQKSFFDLIKSETIHGFNTSQKVMEGYFDYKVAPGHYYGCINLNS